MNKSIFYKNPKNIAIVMAMIFIVDRIFKYLAINSILPNIHAGQFLKLSFIPNHFISFSLPLSGTPLMIIAGLMITIIVLAIIYLIINKKSETLEVVLLTTILFGAISNYTDRVFYGFVIDYIDLQNFTVFNFADTMICLGAAGIILINFRKKRKNV